MQQSMLLEPSVGFDLGGVIRERLSLEQRNPKIYREGAVENVRAIVEKVGADHCFIVSCLDEMYREEARQWLKDHKFYEQTGFRAEHVEFCTHRVQKLMIAQAHNIRIFVDNRREVFEYMGALVPHKILFRPWDKEVDRAPTDIGEVHIAHDWQVVPVLVARMVRRDLLRMRRSAAV
jgi:hypothetical protein